MTKSSHTPPSPRRVFIFIKCHINIRLRNTLWCRLPCKHSNKCTLHCAKVSSSSIMFSMWFLCWTSALVSICNPSMNSLLQISSNKMLTNRTLSSVSERSQSVVRACSLTGIAVGVVVVVGAESCGGGFFVLRVGSRSWCEATDLKRLWEPALDTRRKGDDGNWLPVGVEVRLPVRL